ncbi:MAG: 50S ribosomal protein L7/L12 [Candidatus Omnitrophica bacterium]|nr:50S ribosomal protein L7/L12 [Candidatus Omnitrophota bacterium]
MSEQEKTTQNAEEAEAQAAETQATQDAEPETSDEPVIDLSATASKILEEIKSLSVLELSNLVKALEKEFGVSAQAAIMAAPGAMMTQAGGGAAGGAAEEKTSFNVVLATVGDKKIQVIKEIRAVTNLGLKEAKDLVESAPSTVKEGVSKEEAAEVKAKLEAVGATVEVK